MRKSGKVVSTVLAGVVPGSAWAAVVAPPSFAVPTLDAAGMALLVVLVGGVASWAAKRRRP